jgi:hypothetical protein
VPAGDTLVVVSFNIEKAEKIDLAISELRKFESKLPVDVYLLQEMDEKGVEGNCRRVAMQLPFYSYRPL